MLRGKDPKRRAVDEGQKNRSRSDEVVGGDLAISLERRRVAKGRDLGGSARLPEGGGSLRDEGLRGTEELNDVANLRTVGYLLLDLKDGVVETDLPVEDETIGHG